MSEVNHPQHYQKEGRKECIEEMEEHFGIYNTCIFALISAYKYIYRAGEKEGNSVKQDLDKAAWYLHYAISSIDLPREVPYEQVSQVYSYVQYLVDLGKKVRLQNA